MSSPYEFLSVSDLAGYFAEDNAVRPGSSPVDLEGPVRAWLAKRGLGHRDRDAFAVAIQAVKLAKPAPLPTPEQAAWEHDQMNGISDQRPLSADAALTDRIQNMSMSEWARERQRLNLHQDTLSFLGGTR
jgi:hypothetical protein